MTADEEDHCLIAKANEMLNEDGTFVDDKNCSEETRKMY